ncbi:hypothetical protein EV294_101973 [Paenibacillus sp. BK033]|uniref:hypothetical protein n=1 Tax=Paenibacillus sp. BK033 TaxID=2512133 RepID=UPI00104FFC1B|nr:hypothetical protein [Paenibacillus sp. BK033]TCN01517.1 hypothetical protein EV294_101973 [Paenibacillus sp. BK033]
MSVVNLLASRLGRKDEEPNIELAQRLASEENVAGIQEIIENLSSKDKKIRHDCIKVAYELGEIRPELISPYALRFIELLGSRDNRLVWGAMTALSTIAETASGAIMEHVDQIVSAMNTGSVITVDKAVLALSKLAAVSEANNKVIFPFLLRHLEGCRSKEVPQHSESVLLAVTAPNIEEYLKVLRAREQQLTDAQLKRVKKIYRTLEN